MRTFKTRLLSLALALVMVISMLPAALATDAVPMTRDENESGLVTYTNTATLTNGELSSIMTGLGNYLTNSNEKTEAEAIAAGAKLAVTGAAAAKGEGVTYYYSDYYADTNYANTSAITANAVRKLYGVNGEIVIRFLSDVDTLHLPTSSGYGWVHGDYLKSDATTALRYDMDAAIVVDLGGNTVTTDAGAGFIVSYGGTSVLRNGTLNFNGIRAVFNPNKADAAPGTPYTLFVAENAVINDNGTYKQGTLWGRRACDLVLKNSVINTGNQPCVATMTSGGAVLNMTLENSQIVAGSKLDTTFLGASAKTSHANVTLIGADSWIAHGKTGISNGQWKTLNINGGDYPVAVTSKTYNGATYTATALDLSGYVAAIGNDFFATAEAAMAAASEGDIVELMAAAGDVVLPDGVTLDPKGFTVASVKNIAGEAVAANENGTYGPVYAGVVEVVANGESKFYASLDAAIAATTAGEIKLLADATAAETIVLADGVSLNLNGKTLTGTVVDTIGTEIPAVDGVYDTRSAAVEVTLPDGSKQVVSFAAALTLAEANEGSTIKLLKNVTSKLDDPYTDLLNGTTYIYKATVDTTFDLNGKTLTCEGYGIVTDGAVADVDITILGNGGKIVANAKAPIAINNGSLTASDLTVVSTNKDGNSITLTGEGKTSTLTNVTHDAYRYVQTSANHKLIMEGCKFSAAVKDYFFYGIAGSTIEIVGTENVITTFDGALQGGSSAATFVYEGLDMVKGILPGNTRTSIVFVPTGTVAFNDANGDKVLNEGETAYAAAADFATADEAAIVLTAAVEGDVELAASSTLDTTFAAPAGKVVTTIDGVAYNRAITGKVYKAVDAIFTEGENNVAGTMANVVAAINAGNGEGSVKLLKNFSGGSGYLIDLTKGAAFDLNGMTLTGGTHMFRFMNEIVDLTQTLEITGGTINVTCSAVRALSGNVTLKDVVINCNVVRDDGVGMHPLTLINPNGTNVIEDVEIYRKDMSPAFNNEGVCIAATEAGANTTIKNSILVNDHGVAVNGSTNNNTVLSGTGNVIKTTTEEFAKPNVKVQSVATTAEPTEEETYYVTTFAPLDGTAFVDYDENGEYSDGDSMHENVQDAIDEVMMLLGYGTVVLNKDIDTDVMLYAGNTLKTGAYTTTGKVQLVADDMETVLYEDIMPYRGTYSTEVEAEYILNGVTYAATWDAAFSAAQTLGTAEGTIKLMADKIYPAETGNYPINFTADYDLTIDLNGYTIENEDNVTVDESGVETRTGKHLLQFQRDKDQQNHLTIMDTSEAKTGTMKAGKSVIAVRGGGTVTLDGITMISSGDAQPTVFINAQYATAGRSEIRNATIVNEANMGISYAGGAVEDVLAISDTTIEAALAALNINGKGIIKLEGTNVTMIHGQEAFYNLSSNGEVQFDAGYTYNTTSETVGEGEEAVTTYTTVITTVELGDAVVGFTAPGAEEVKYYLVEGKLADDVNNTYPSVEAAVGAATADWKEVKTGEIDIYADVYITDRTLSAISGTNFVYQNYEEDSSLVFDLNGNNIYYGSEDDSVAPAAGSSGNPALFSNAKNGYLEVKNGNIEWAGSRAFYLAGGSSAGADKNGEKTTGETRFTNVNVTYNSNNAIFNVNNAFATETTPAAKITIDGGVWTHGGDNVIIYSSNDSDGTIFYITGGAEIHAEARDAGKTIVDGSPSGMIYVDDATIYTSVAMAGDMFHGNTAYTLGNPEGGLAKATVTATETEGINKIVIAEATADDYVANVNGEGYFNVAEAVAATSKYDTVNVIKTPAESAITLKATTYMAVAEGVDMTGITVSYENGVEAVLTDGVYAPAEAVYTYGDITVKGTARQAFQAWAANGNVGTITLMDDLTLTELNELGTGESRHFIIMWDGYELTLNLNGHTIKRNTNTGATTAPNFIMIAGDSKVEINGGADATDTANRGTIQWTGTRAILQVGGTDQRENSINAAFNNLKIEGYARNGSVATISGTSAEMGNTIVFNNVDAHLYNALYSSDARYPSNVKVVVTGNTTLIARKNVFTMGTDDTLTLGENVKIYGREDVALKLEDRFGNVAEYTFTENTEDTIQSKHYRAGEGYGSDQLEGYGSATDIHYAYVATPVELTANAVNVYETGDENITVVADKAEAKKGEVVSLTVNVNGDYAVNVAVTTESGRVIRLSSDNKFVMPNESVAVNVYADLNKYNVSLYAAGVENGTVVADVTEAAAGQTVTLTATPDEGYMVDQYFAQTADDKTAIAVSGNTFVMPGEAVEFFATFKVVPASYNVYVNGGENGTVVVNPTTAPAGATITVETAAAAGYELQTLSVFAYTTGEAVAVVDNTFVMPEGGANIFVSFAEKKYDITVTASANGAITTDASAAEGKTVVVDVEPAEGYELDTLTVTTASGVAVEVNGVTFVMPAEAVTVSATFKSSVKYYNVTVNNATNGTVTATATGSVKEGTEVTVTVAANEGYKLAALTVNGTAVKVVDGKYTFTVDADATIAATFKAIPVAVLKAFTLGVEDEILLNFKLTIPDEVINDDNSYVKMTRSCDIAGVDKYVIMTAEELRPTKDSSNRYVPTIGMAGPLMTYDVMLEVFDGNGEAILITDGTTYGDGSTKAYVNRAVQDYYKDQLGRSGAAYDRLKTLIVAMATYGGYAQKQFGHNSNNPVYNILPTFGKEVADLTGITAADMPQRATATGADIGASYVSQTVALNAAVSMNVNFKLTQPLDNYTITYEHHEKSGGKFVVETTEVVPVYDAARGRYTVVLDKIEAAFWDYMYDIVITEKATGESFTISTCVMAYCGDKFASLAAYQNLFRAMYFYNQAAKTYFMV